MRREASDDAPLQAIFVGRLVAEKGLSTLFEAIAAAFGNSRQLQLRVVGNGPLEAALRAQAVALGIADAVEFLGHREDIDALLAGADLGLLPSTIEGLSNTLLECMRLKQVQREAAGESATVATTAASAGAVRVTVVPLGQRRRTRAAPPRVNR